MASEQCDLSPVYFLAPILGLSQKELESLSLMSVEYPGIVTISSTNPGQKLTAAELVPLKGADGRLPQVTCAELKDDAVYHLAFFDPDAPEDPTKNGPFGDWQWLVLGLSKDDLSTASSTDAFVKKQVMAHDGPNPPAGEGQHRYVFVLFEGSSDVNKPAGEPKSWLFKKFVEENTGSLRPIGLNYYFAEQ